MLTFIIEELAKSVEYGPGIILHLIQLFIVLLFNHFFLYYFLWQQEIFLVFFFNDIKLPSSYPLILLIVHAALLTSVSILRLPRTQELQSNNRIPQVFPALVPDVNQLVITYAYLLSLDYRLERLIDTSLSWSIEVEYH